MLLIALRVAIGWHFFYEGVWKIKHADEFSARPFLTMAKGPFAPMFHSMVPDLDGEVRLALTETDQGVTSQVYLDAWTEAKEAFVGDFQLTEEQTKKVDKLFEAYKVSLEEYLTENQEEIEAHFGTETHFGSLARFRERAASGVNEAVHEKKRIWDQRAALRSEAAGWLSELDGMGEDFCLGLWNLLDDGQKATGALSKVVTAPEKLPIGVPCVDSRSELLDASIIYGLTAIGLGLMLGCCTRLACLGGCAFLISVLLTQPPWPPIYPPAPAPVGHALLIDKNFVEMMALFALAAMPVGRWAGLDYFLHHWFGRRVLAFFAKKV